MSASHTTTSDAKRTGQSSPATETRGASLLQDIRARALVGGARFSPDGRYRYCLSRKWEPRSDARGRILWVMLNPSTAGALADDATIRRVMAFSHLWGFHHVRVVNLYAYRATKPENLWAAAIANVNIIGPENTKWIDKEASKADQIVCAWGGNADLARPRVVWEQLKQHQDTLYCLGETATLQPVHPLRIPYSQPLTEWTPRHVRPDFSAPRAPKHSSTPNPDSLSRPKARDTLHPRRSNLDAG